MAITWKKVAYEADVITKAFMAAKGDLISASADNTPLILPVGANDLVLTAASGEATGLKWAAGGGGGVADYVKVSDTKAYNVAGGAFTQDAWRTRDINTEDSDVGGICTISSNQITLQPGTYICQISCPAFSVLQHVTRLYNISDTAVELIGTSEYSKYDIAAFSANRSFISGQFTIATAKTFEVQHYCARTQAVNGFGVTGSVANTNSVYTIAEFWRVAA